MAHYSIDIKVGDLNGIKTLGLKIVDFLQARAVGQPVEVQKLNGRGCYIATQRGHVALHLQNNVLTVQITHGHVPAGVQAFLSNLFRGVVQSQECREPRCTEQATHCWEGRNVCRDHYEQFDEAFTSDLRYFRDST